VLPEISEDEITDVTISKSEKLMTFFAGGSRTPSNIYVYNLEDKTCTKLAHSLSPDIDEEDLVYGNVIRFASYDGMEIPALYYKPHNVPKGGKIPALIWVHGGPGGQSRATYNYLLQYIVNHGYAVLAINNRGSSGYGKTFYRAADRKHGEADLDDCMWAKKFLVASGDIDENKVGIMGGSYGGYMTLAALAFRPQEMAVGVDIFGVTNWIQTLKSIPAWWEIEREALYKKIGDPEIDAEYLKSISPLFHANNIVKPLLVLQGANDPRVLKAESDQIIESISKNDIPYQYVVFDDEGHGFSKKKNKMVAAVTILEFLDLYLK
jgi:dipeptidyl aminopeptidase/acylaminoacyl peptidase